MSFSSKKPSCVIDLISFTDVAESSEKLGKILGNYQSRNPPYPSQNLPAQS